ncbi:MAG: helix-turn-helix transcriptional regulator [Ruminococcaceae bacterium]|nr:helix-turn-helix transcriptional regulator [Oscillospiraceae bacterium]
MNRIKQLREDRDLRQIDVAEQVGIDQRTLSNYETGKTNPDSFAIVRLAAFYGVSCDYLLGVSDDSFRNLADVSAELERIRQRLELLQKHIDSMRA